MFDDVHLVPEDGHAVAVFTLGEELRNTLGDVLSWHVNRSFRAGALEAEAVLELRAAGALADRFDQFRGEEGRAPVRLSAAEVRMLIGAVHAYISERDIESYQSPEERERLAILPRLIDPLFDLAADLDRADEVLSI